MFLVSFYERRASFSFLTQTVRSYRQQESKRMPRIEIFVRIHLVSLWVLCMFDNKYGLADACRSLEFTPPHDGHALVNHVMVNITVDRQDACRVSCYLDDYCLSYNFGPLQDGHFVCQLSDSDHIQHPEDLKKIDGFVYLGTENACSNNKCSTHGKCAINPTDNTYYCICQPGFVGKYCEHAVYMNCSEAPKVTGMYNMTLGNESEHFPVYCDQTSDKGGWAMIFKVVANAAPVYIAKLWNSSNTHSENVTVALNTTTAHSGHYKNRIVLANNWRNFKPREARVVLYKAGAEVRFLKFNATGMDNINWFSQEQLINSSWPDLASDAAQFKHFDIYGDVGVRRSFEISTPYGNCNNDGGWLVITSTSSDNCQWAKLNNVSSILYSATWSSVKFKHYDKTDQAGLADVLVVFVR